MPTGVFLPAKKPLLWILFLGLQLLFINFARQHPQWIEEVYSQGIYPIVFQFQSRFFSLIPFSMGDLFYSIGLLALFYYLYTKFKYRPRIRGWWFSDALIFISLAHFFFYFSWGLHYYRIPLHQKLNYKLSYTETQLTQTLTYYLEQTNRLHEELSEADSLPVLASHSKEELLHLIENNYQLPLTKNHEWTPHAKNSLWSLPLSFAGYAGYLNPFTLESQINKRQPPLSFVTTAAHEMAHQWGIAAEDEANFISFYSLSKHPNPYLQYAAHAFALRYLYYDLYRVDPELAKNYRQQMRKGVLQNFQILAHFWAQYENPIEPYLKQFYHQFLKVNGQQKGLKSYNAVVAYMVAHYQENKQNLK